MHLSPGTLLTLLLVVGLVAQWVAWRIRLPAILPLLLIGIVLGPALDVFDPDAVFGAFLFPSVSLAVAVILFEGSLTLRFRELKETGRAIRGLVSYGAILAVLLLAAAAHWIAGVGWPVAFLFGAVACVTGPTVITPLLLTLRPVRNVASALRWEGIVLDPLGALFAVLVFQGIISQQQGQSVLVFLVTVGIGALAGLIAAVALGYILLNQLIPEYLHNFGTLAAVIGVFTLSNSLASESGLLAVTIMGIALGNSRVHVDDIMSFKKDLSLLLVSLLFIVLAARLPWPLPDGMLVAGLLVFLVAQFVIRPITAWLATWGSDLNWRERVLLGFVAPRGVVAAAVSSVFALRLGDYGMADIDALVPLVFILIIGTVVLQSIAARPLARVLRVAEPEPTGVLVFGANKVARTLATALRDNGVDVLIVSENWRGISAARMAGLPTFYGNPTSRHAEMRLDLTPIGWMLGVSMWRERNHLACLHYRDKLGRNAVYHMQIQSPEEASDRESYADVLRSPALFSRETTLSGLESSLDSGARIKSGKLTEAFGWSDFKSRHGEDTLLLFALAPNGQLHIANDHKPTEPQKGWTVIALVPPRPAKTASPQADG